MRLNHKAISAALTLTLSISGCVTWEQVKPTELPKLNGSGHAPLAAQNTSNTVIGVLVTSVEAPDGRLVEVKGDFDVRIATDNRKIQFDHPVRSEVEEGMLSLRSSDRGLTQFLLEDVKSAEVSQDRPQQTIWAIAGATTLATLLFFIFAPLQ